MIIDSALYRGGVRIPLACTKEDLRAVRSSTSEPGDFIWVGLHEPDTAELSAVAEAFELHPLAVEDAVNAHQRPKLERYGDGIFLVLKTLWYVDENDAVETGEINLFVGRDFVVSVRHGEGTELHTARLDLEQRTTVLDHGPSAVVYAICDRVVDSYEEVASALEADVDEVEESVFSPSRTQDSRRIYILKRELSEVRRAVNPLREPMKRFATGSVPVISQESAPFFRDVADHVLRVSEAVEALDSLLSTAFDAHLARISVQQNEDMRKISAWVAIAAVGTLVAGIYGMNFEYMPELRWHFGYFGALGVMLVASVVLYRVFKKSGWL
ncbi:magnesium/cobalt transporter CorA [Nocardioides mesophilus]|uniref:Magnesium transport protein CorA n=1 Tax=Nocardioides mesophilus TaxID=433659 RepID=A0A7G9RAZ3_9ACTN|nr:magnesium/cobalt transporter CorA [Nocardioides mesophilus]QNN52768.1 magnesium/cobalt transporter CorA [Nocardioides mesophilus]